MIDILLLSPPYVNYDNRNKPKLIVFTSFFPPIGLAYLSSFLHQHDFKTQIIDMEADKLKISEISKILRVLKPKVIGISIISDLTYLISYKIIKKIKSISNIPVIVGGIFPTQNPDFLINKSEIDYVIRGEGEKTLLELMEFLISSKGNLKNINGISYKINGQIIHNPQRELIKNLDEIPFPKWNKHDVNKYFISIAYKNPCFALTASRGCPYRCIFCSTSVFQYYRHRSPSNVVDEIEYLIKNFKIKDFTFHDPTFNINPNWVIDFCKELLKRKINIKWRCLCRVDKVTEKMIAYMKITGCYNIAFGIESSKDKFLEFLQKDFTIQQVRDTIKIVKKYKIEILAYFIYGMPNQKIEDLEHNVQFIKELSPDYINILMLNPVVGTKLWDLAMNKGWLKGFNLDTFEYPEILGVQKQWWQNPNLNEDILNFYIKKSFLVYLFSFKTIFKFIVKFIKNPLRYFYAIRNIIQRFAY